MDIKSGKVKFLTMPQVRFACISCIHTNSNGWMVDFQNLSPILWIGFHFNVGLKSFLQQGLSEPEFYGDLVYRLRNIVSSADFSDQFRKFIICYTRIGYNINLMRQSAC